jgi:hypothetical protein
VGGHQRAALDIEADEEFVDGLLAKAIGYLRIEPDSARPAIVSKADALRATGQAIEVTDEADFIQLLAL